MGRVFLVLAPFPHSRQGVITTLWGPWAAFWRGQGWGCIPSWRQWALVGAGGCWWAHLPQHAGLHRRSAVFPGPLALAVPQQTRHPVLAQPWASRRHSPPPLPPSAPSSAFQGVAGAGLGAAGEGGFCKGPSALALAPWHVNKRWGRGAPGSSPAAAGDTR